MSVTGLRNTVIVVYSYFVWETEILVHVTLRAATECLLSGIQPL